jgi:hypothetical protein
MSAVPMFGVKVSKRSRRRRPLAPMHCSASAQWLAWKFRYSTTAVCCARVGLIVRSGARHPALVCGMQLAVSALFGQHIMPVPHD